MKILVVDSEHLTPGPLTARLTLDGYDVVEAVDGKSTTALIEQEVPDLVLLDVHLPDTDSLEILQLIQERAADIPVIFITSATSVAKAVEAMKLGAFDYLTKPCNMEELSVTVKRALEIAHHRRVVNLHLRTHRLQHCVDNIVGRSQAMQDIRSLIGKVAQSDATTVLTRGESGTGKDMIAKSIHAESARAEGPFVSIRCSAREDTDLESELYGHERGALPGAKAMKKGLLEMAHGGTLLIDEIGAMSPALQSKLLRVLKEKAFRRLGGSQDIRADVRIVAATHVNLEQQIEERKFQKDLYYRLNAITIDIPPLRARREDIAPLAEHFLKQFTREFKKPTLSISRSMLKQLEGYDWPGNVRELRNVIERAVLLTTGPILSAEDILLGRASALLTREPAPRVFDLPPAGIDLEELDRDLVAQALERTGDNYAKAAELLSLTRDRFHNRMLKYGLIKTGTTPV